MKRFLALFSTVTAESDSKNWFESAVRSSIQQVELAAGKYSPELNPRSLENDGSVKLADPKDWTSGFFPGSLWYAYELSGIQKMANEAKRFTLALDSAQYFTHTHDLGFILFCSYGNAYRLTNDKIYLKPLENGAASLYSRYNKNVKAIRSWDFGHWQFPVIIDNMMNLEFLFWSAKKFDYPKYYNAALNHAVTTMKNHFRKNFSSYHVVSYDTISGKAIEKGTYQGLTNESSWARGQAWGLYGFVMSYLETGDKRFLTQAEKIADFIMKQETKDKIPYWDFDIPNKERGLKDASAGAITASALLQMSKIVSNGKKYFNYAEEILKSLSSEKYMAKPGTNHLFILEHSLGAFLYHSEVDVPINYTDYYYLEALSRYAQLKGIHTKNFF